MSETTEEIGAHKLTRGDRGLLPHSIYAIQLNAFVIAAGCWGPINGWRRAHQGQTRSREPLAASLIRADPH
jgi:hypothetical protein